MKIKLDEQYKVLRPFEIDLPDFTVITGINGAGKSQLLKAISEKKAKIIGNSNNLKIRYVTNSVLSEEEVPQAARGIKKLGGSEPSFINLYNEFKANSKIVNAQNVDGWEKLFPQIDPRRFKLLEKIFKKLSDAADIDIYNLEVKDLNNYIPINTNLSGSIFFENFQNIFYRYAVKLRENDLLETQVKKYGIANLRYLDEKEFVTYYGEAPWDFANSIFDEAKINYYFKAPIGFNPDLIFRLILCNKSTDQEVSFEDMSSGEKVILSLIFARYNSKSEIDFPDVILMDEPDASLHPSMIKHFLDVVKNIFVKEKKIKVIITTHSPTTVALADEENIFVVTSHEAVIEKTTKDAALKILTEGVPSFSVNYKNRRQVFVESPYDVEYYERLYAIFSSNLEPEISLHFIASGDVQKDKVGIAKNSCDIVKDITNLMRDAGNNFIWGIIDFDNKNESTDFIKVLGQGNRYSTENYFFDPILLAVFLLIDDSAKAPYIGLIENETYLSIDNFDNERLQLLCDLILLEIKKYIVSEDNDLIMCRLVNGNEVQLPNWFLKHQGHDLESAIKKTFPQLNSFNKDGDKTLKVSIIKKVIAIFPGLASEDLLIILKAVQE